MDRVPLNEADGAARAPSPAPTALARILAATAGYVDAAGYVALVHLFTAHQSGNTAGLGAALASGSWTDTWRRITAIGAFTLGVGLGTAMVEVNNRHRPNRSAAILAAAELGLLALALGLGQAASTHGVLRPADGPSYAVVAAALAGAMGLQTVSLRRVGGRTVRTTFVTGVITNLTESFVVAWADRDRRRRRRTWSFSTLLGSVWVMYLAGAVAGAGLERAWSFAALSLPMAATAIVAVWDLRAPYRPDLPAPASSE